MDPISIGCLCPPSGDRHPDGDTVELFDPLPFQRAVTMQKAVGLFVNDQDAPPEAEEILGALTQAYVVNGIESWSLVDDKGKPLPVSRANIETYLLSSLDDAMVVADAADEAFGSVVMRPLLARASRSSLTTPTDGSTSAPMASPPASPKRSRRSSTITSLTGVTETTSESPDGDSNSSPNSASAA